MNVKLIAHTIPSSEFMRSLPVPDVYAVVDKNPRQAVALTAIRTCYSPNAPSEILALEGAKYFGQSAKDGEAGTEADRLFRHIVRSGHASTLEHITYTFAIEGVSRALLAQLTRHRQFSFSVQSQRYVKFGSGDKASGFDYVIPDSISDDKFTERGENPYHRKTAVGAYTEAMETLQKTYDQLREAGVPAEDARFVLPNAAACNIVMTANLRAILEFYGKRNASTHAQWEISDLSELIRSEIIKVDPWLDKFFERSD